MSAELQLVHGQPSWRLATDDVEAFVTQSGGHLGPVTFDRRGRAIQPLSVAPWTADEPGAVDDPLLRVLRGDFFTLPFGANADPYDGERHPYHGETAQAAWTREADSRPDELHLSLSTTVRPGRVDKWIRVRPGHPAVYQHHRITGMSGPMALGHHAMVLFPDREGSGVLSTSRFAYGQVYPGTSSPTRAGSLHSSRALSSPRWTGSRWRAVVSPTSAAIRAVADSTTWRWLSPTTRCPSRGPR